MRKSISTTFDTNSLEKEQGYARRKVSKSVRYRDGKIIQTTERSEEYLLPYKMHILNVEKSEGKESRLDFIDVDGASFCKRDNGAWQRVTYPCIFGPRMTGVLNIVNSKYTTEIALLDGASVRINGEYTTYKNNASPNKNAEGLSFMETKYWLRDDGLLLRRIVRTGLVKPERIYSETIDTYEYNPKNLSIEVPIK